MIKDIQMSFSQLMYLGSENQNDIKEANLTTHKDVDLFLRLLLNSGREIGGVIDKLNISFTNDKKQLEYFNNDVSDIVTIYLPFPYNNILTYLKLTKKDKVSFIYKNILIAFIKLNDRLLIDLDLIKDLIEDCKKLDYKNHYYLGKFKSSKNRKYKAGVWIEHEMEIFKLYIDILDKGGNVFKREKVIETSPGYPKYFPLLGGVKWIGNEEVQFFNRKREVLKTFSV